MSILDLYSNYGIEVSPDGHKHHRPGWVNINCPFCSSPSDKFPLGFNLEGGYFYCWTCGSHSIEATLSKLLRLNSGQVEELLRIYRLKQHSRSSDAKEANSFIKIGAKKYRRPSEVGPLQKSHIKYLIQRGYDPDYLASTFGVLGTGPTSVLDKIPYKFRIFLPILWRGKEVSFQTRDYTGKQALKYITCPMEREIVHHKHILYAHPSLFEKRKGVVVEGAFDAWRFRTYACATLGTGFTKEQVRIMAKLFDSLVIMFDPEPAAQKRAKQLHAELVFRGVKSIVYDSLPSDPGDLSQKDADYILKELKL